MHDIEKTHAYLPTKVWQSAKETVNLFEEHDVLKLTRRWEDDKGRIVAEVTYCKYTNHFMSVVSFGALAGLMTTVAVATCIICLVNMEAVRRVCSELQWTKFRIQSKMSPLGYWLKALGYPAPWYESYRGTAAPQSDPGSDWMFPSPQFGQDVRTERIMTGMKNHWGPNHASAAMTDNYRRKKFASDSSSERNRQNYWRRSVDNLTEESGNKQTLESVSVERPPWEKPYRGDKKKLPNVGVDM